MAKAVAIRQIVDIEGQQFIGYTYGTPPLGSVATTENSYMNVEELKRQIERIELKLGEEGLMLLHLAITYLKPDGTFNNTNQVYNKTLTLDPFAAQPLKIT
jgi:hypothetical protein